MMPNDCRPLIRHGCLLAFGLVIASAGCSGRLATYPVQGRVVTSDGRPIETGRVEFRSAEHGVSARGKIQTDGSFLLTTYRTDDGAVAGNHQVVVVQLIIHEHGKTQHADHGPVVPRRYNSYTTSGLTATVNRSSTNEIILVIENN